MFVPCRCFRRLLSRRNMQRRFQETTLWSFFLNPTDSSRRTSGFPRIMTDFSMFCTDRWSPSALSFTSSDFILQAGQRKTPETRPRHFAEPEATSKTSTTLPKLPKVTNSTECSPKTYASSSLNCRYGPNVLVVRPRWSFENTSALWESFGRVINVFSSFVHLYICLFIKFLTSRVFGGSLLISSWENQNRF